MDKNQKIRMNSLENETKNNGESVIVNDWYLHVIYVCISPNKIRFCIFCVEKDDKEQEMKEIVVNNAMKIGFVGHVIA